MYLKTDEEKCNPMTISPTPKKRKKKNVYNETSLNQQAEIIDHKKFSSIT